MADSLDQVRSNIDKRLKELRPLHDEYLKLEQAKAALQGIGSSRRGPGRPRGSGNGRRRRRRGRGARTLADRALAEVRRQPGVTVATLSQKLNVKHKNYLYRVMNGLQKDGAVKKDGRGYVAA